MPSGSKPGARRGGRQKGTPDKATAALKDAILQAAENLGQDGNGTGSLIGYLTFLAQEEPKAFAGLLGKVLPMQLTGEGGGPMVVELVRFSDSHTQ